MRSPNAYSSRWFEVFSRTIAPEQTLLECAFLRGLTQKDNPSYLDVCCGQGRHCIELARVGFSCVGIDRDGPVIESATQVAPEGATFLQCDIADPPAFDTQFDIVSCLWQSFGFGDECENVRVMRWMISQASPTGSVVLDIYNPDFFRDHLGVIRSTRAGVGFRETKTMDHQRLHVRIEYEDQPQVDEFSWRLYTPVEIDQVAQESGWTVDACCSGFNREQPAKNSEPRMQLVLRQQHAV